MTSLLLTSVFWLLTPAFAATHVTATYDLGANPHVMATVNGTPQYGLVFAQRNKPVTYGGVEYGPSVVKGYLNSSGQLNDGAGNLWLDLIPNLGATPGDSYYVVTLNIQGRVHAEIWVVPDVASVAAEVCRQAQPPSSTAPALFYQFLQQAGEDFPQRQKLNFTGSGVSCVDNAGQLRTDCAFSGGGGSSTPKASATVSGTVKTDTTASDPVVYLQSSTDSLLAGKVPATRNISTSSPLSGGGALSTDLTLTCPTCEVTGNKNAANGYAGLSASTKINLAQIQEVMGSADLSDLGGLFGTSAGTKAVTTALAGDPATDNCVKWIAGGKLGDAGVACGSGGGSHNLLSATHSDTMAASAVRGDGIFAIGASPTWQRLAHPTVAGGYFKWNGTDIVASTNAAAGPGSCTNQVVTAENADAAPTCTTVTSSYVDSSIEKTTNKNAASGYAGLTAATKLNAAQGQEVWGLADLTDVSATSGSGSTAILATFTSLAANDILKWSGTNWANSASAAKADAFTSDPTDCSTNQYATAIAANGNLTCSQPATSNLSDGSNIVKNNQTNTYSAGTQDFENASVTRPFRRLGYASFPSSCTANREFLERSDPATAGQVLYVCNSAGNGWDLVGDGGTGGGGDNLSVNGAAASDADFDDTTPAAPANAVNVKWQKDTSTPNNVSAHVPYTAPLTVTSGNLDCLDASSSVKGCLTSTDWTTFNGKANLVGSGTAGVGPSKAGTATTAARSDHDHRSVHALTWFFPGTPATGVQNFTLTFPDGSLANLAVLDMRVTVNTTSAGSSTFNVQRCTASCTGTSPTFANIYSANLTLNASTRTANKGSAPDQNVSGLAAGDQFKANLVTIGASLADVTVTMTYKYDTQN